MRSCRAGVMARAPGSSRVYSSTRLPSSAEAATRLPLRGTPRRELLAFEEVAVQDHLVVPCESLADGLGVHVGIAIHVAAGPGTEVQDGGQSRRAAVAAVDLLQRLGDFLVEVRHYAVEDLDEIEQDLLALVRHREP